ncbi:MAG: ribosome maturation factor RimM [Chitinispirillales bacterium]|nr:ribosome maturation factor RimM [Chitinispirillales bacterium]
MDLVAIAIIKRAIGLDGLCGLRPYGETLGRLKAPVAVYIGEDERRVREAVMEKLVLRQQGHAAIFDMAHDRTEAEKLTGQNVYLREEHLPPLEDGQYYHFHLKGMAVVSERQGNKIGVVKDTVNLPSTDALEITLMSGYDIIVPYNKQAVVRVDEENRVVVVSDSYIEELL